MAQAIDAAGHQIDRSRAASGLGGTPSPAERDRVAQGIAEARADRREAAREARRAEEVARSGPDRAVEARLADARRDAESRTSEREEQRAREAAYDRREAAREARRADAVARTGPDPAVAARADDGDRAAKAYLRARAAAADRDAALRWEDPDTRDRAVGGLDRGPADGPRTREESEAERARSGYRDAIARRAVGAAFEGIGAQARDLAARARALAAGGAGADRSDLSPAERALASAVGAVAEAVAGIVGALGAASDPRGGAPGRAAGVDDRAQGVGAAGLQIGRDYWADLRALPGDVADYAAFTLERSRLGFEEIAGTLTPAEAERLAEMRGQVRDRVEATWDAVVGTPEAVVDWFAATREAWERNERVKDLHAEGLATDRETRDAARDVALLASGAPLAVAGAARKLLHILRGPADGRGGGGGPTPTRAPLNEGALELIERRRAETGWEGPRLTRPNADDPRLDQLYAEMYRKRDQVEGGTVGAALQELADPSTWVRRDGRVEPPHAQKVRNRYREITGYLSDRSDPIPAGSREAAERIQRDLREAWALIAATGPNK